MKDPVIGEKPMKNMLNIFNGNVRVVELADAGHFVQEWGEQVWTIYSIIITTSFSRIVSMSVKYMYIHMTSYRDADIFIYVGCQGSRGIFRPRTTF